MSSSRYPALILIAALQVLLAVSAASGVTVPVRTDGGKAGAHVRSFREIRNSRLVRQGWDISCGAAALSTVFKYHFGRDVSETTIAVSILKNTDPRRVRARGGFSLLDLKRFAEALGYEAKGYGGLELADLSGFGRPAIVPVRIRGYDHFVVFRAYAANRVLVGDPAFGNLTMTTGQFLDIWKSRIAFVVTEKGDSGPDADGLAPGAAELSVPDLGFVGRSLRSQGPVPEVRRR